MSKLARKAAMINFDEPLSESSTKAADRPRTGPGAVSAALVVGREVFEENQRLKAEVARIEDAQIIELLDPKEIGPSRYANRHERSFDNAAFRELRREIASAGRNVQSIKVRKLAEPRGEIKYEIVFGHRRHRACLEEGLKVAAVVEDDFGDLALFAEMDRENRARADLSPWEQGVMYKRALDDGLYPSQRQMAQHLGIDQGNLSKVVQLASLPEEVLEAFPSPLDLQHRWASHLHAAYERAPDETLAKAMAVRTAQPRPTAKEVFELLTATEGAIRESRQMELKAGDVVVGSWIRDGRGNLTVKLRGGAIAGPKEKQLREFVEQLLGS